MWRAGILPHGAVEAEAQWDTTCHVKTPVVSQPMGVRAASLRCFVKMLCCDAAAAAHGTDCSSSHLVIYTCNWACRCTWSPFTWTGGQLHLPSPIFSCVPPHLPQGGLSPLCICAACSGREGGRKAAEVTWTYCFCPVHDKGLEQTSI